MSRLSIKNDVLCKLLFALTITLCCITHGRASLYCDSDSGIIVTETVVDSEIEDLQWLGTAKGDRSILAQTKLRRVYLSQDDGQTWTNIDTKLINARNGKTNNTLAITSIITSSDPSTAYIQGTKGDLWYTNDKGNTWNYVSSQLYKNSYIQKVLPNPSNPLQVLIYVGAPSCYSYSGSGCNYTLLFSGRYGLNPTTISAYVTRGFFFGKTESSYTKIFYEEFKTKSGDQRYKSRWDCRLSWTKDYGKSHVEVLNHTAGSILKFGTVFVAQLLNMQGELQFLSSRNLGEGAFNIAKFPTNVDEARYTIVDTHDDLIFVNVQLEETYWGNLYVSDDNDTTFVLSLEKVHRSVYGHSDVTKIAKISGIYVANVVDTSYSADKSLNTLISFDDGGQWNRIKAPLNDSNGAPVNCQGGVDCYLNLNINDPERDASEEYGPIYSKENAVGLIIATGNVGSTLSNDMNTYFSNDAGSTWYEIAKGSYAYEFGDHGGLTVMASNADETDEIMYSWNQGESFTTCEFTGGSKKRDPEDAVRVLDIVSTPDNTAVTFILHGTRVQQGATKGVLVSLDFSGSQMRKCTDDDYEIFTPSDPHNELGPSSGCILGEATGYKRRKRDAQCYNGEDYETVVGTGSCPCGPDDYECDECFESHSEDSLLCLPVCEVPVPDSCEGSYEVSNGYRLVTATKCDIASPHALNLLKPIQVPCPTGDDSFHKKSKGAAVGAVIGSLLSIVIFVLIGFTVYYSRKYGSFAAALSKITSGGKSPKISRANKSSSSSFGGVGFSRLDTEESDHLESGDEAKELEDEDILSFTEPNANLSDEEN